MKIDETLINKIFNKNQLKRIKIKKKRIDKFIFHQASKYMLDNINRRLSIEKSKTFENYGYGWFINKKNHIYHGGSYFHTTTHFHLIPEKNIGIVLSVNTNFSGKWSIIKEFKRLIN